MTSTAVSAFFESVFGHDLLHGHHVGVSRFTPNEKVHAFHTTPTDAAAWAIQQAGKGDVYFRTTPIRNPPERGKRGSAAMASAILGVHGDIDIADGVHKKTNLPPDQESARRVIEVVGIKPTLIVHSGHGLQPHWLLGEPFVFEKPEDHLHATQIGSRFQKTLAAAARSVGGWENDNVGDLARILRIPGTFNRKREVVPVTLLLADGPRYLLDDIESVLVQEDVDPVAPVGAVFDDEQSGGGFVGSDDDLLASARAAKNGKKFGALFDDGDLAPFAGDHSRADWAVVNDLAFWCGPHATRIDGLFRRSKLMRPKWDETRGGDGKTYGEMTVADVLSKRKSFFGGPRLQAVIVNIRQLRDETADAVAALETMNKVPAIFQRGSDIVRVRKDEITGRSLIQVVGVDHMIEMMTRAADFVTPNGDSWLAVRPPVAVAKNILALPAWRFPPLHGIVSAPRIRPDGSVLWQPGYDAASMLLLTEYEGSESFAVRESPTSTEVQAAIDLLDELVRDFRFTDLASRANFFAFMFSPILRPAIAGSLPICAFDALSKQGTGKSLLLRVAVIVATGREPAMSAIPEKQDEFAKALTAILLEGREVVAFDNASGFVESGVWSNAVTSPIFDNRLLGLNKQAQLPVRCAWAITGNGLTLGPDLARRTYLVLQDAGVERPEERTGFLHPLPEWAVQNRVRLQQAAITICRSWWARGCPAPKVRPMGSFEDWTRVVGGVLEIAGVVGFLDNQREFRDHTDTERGEWQAFVVALADTFPGRVKFSCAEVITAIENGDRLRQSLPGRLADALAQKASFSTRLGKAVRKHAGSIFGAWRLEDVGKDSHSKKPLYRVIPSDTQVESAGGAGHCGGSPYPPTCGNTEIPV